MLLSTCFVIFSCGDIESIVSTEWKKCKDKDNCIIDFAHLMSFEWDTMCFYSMGCSYDAIIEDLGFNLKEDPDLSDLVIFLNNGKGVYQEMYFHQPSEPPEGIVFTSDSIKFRVSKREAKFKIEKVEKAFFLTRCSTTKAEGADKVSHKQEE